MKILETDNQIANLILEAMAGELDKCINKAAIKIEREVRELVKLAITLQPEYDSLLGGKLKTEFGLPDSANRLNTIIKIWSQSVIVVPIPVKRIGTRLKGGLTVNMIHGDFQDVLNISEAYLVTEKGETLNWLEWLLKYGDRAIIRDYTIRANPKRSRTGVDIMIRAEGKRWSVPPEFAGTVNNNFVTRAMDLIVNDIPKAVQKGIESSL